jgi:hypothetical protein
MEKMFLSPPSANPATSAAINGLLARAADIESHTQRHGGASEFPGSLDSRLYAALAAATLAGS